MSTEGCRREKWHLLRQLLSIRPSTSHRGSCIENIFWEVAATMQGDYHTIKPGLFVSAISNSLGCQRQPEIRNCLTRLYHCLSITTGQLDLRELLCSLHALENTRHVYENPSRLLFSFFKLYAAPGGSAVRSDVVRIISIAARSTGDEMQKYVRRASLALRSGASSFVVNAQQRTTSVNTFPVRAYAASGESPVPLISTAVGSRTTSLAECFQRLSQINAEIKESRQLRLGGKEVKMFLTVGATEADLKKALDSMEFSYVEVEKARDTMQDIKGPYCETSPLLPFFRRIQLRAPYTKAIEMKITDLMCKQGVTISHLDQYRSGKDIIMEGIAHMPTGVAEFPKLDEAIFVQNLEKEGIMVKEFSKIVGNPVNK